MVDLSPGNIFIWKDINLDTVFIIYLILKPTVKPNSAEFVILFSTHPYYSRGFKTSGEFINTFVDQISVSIELIN